MTLVDRKGLGKRKTCGNFGVYLLLHVRNRQSTRVDDHRIRSWFERGYAAGAVARIALGYLGVDGAKINRFSLCQQLFIAPLGADFRRCGQE